MWNFLKAKWLEISQNAFWHWEKGGQKIDKARFCHWLISHVIVSGSATAPSEPQKRPKSPQKNGKMIKENFIMCQHPQKCTEKFSGSSGRHQRDGGQYEGQWPPVLMMSPFFRFKGVFSLHFKLVSSRRYQLFFYAQSRALPILTSHRSCLK